MTHLHILIKGTVEERSPDGKEVFAHYANDDLFDVRAMFEEQSKHQYMALEDTLSYLLPKSIFCSCTSKMASSPPISIITSPNGKS